MKKKMNIIAKQYFSKYITSSGVFTKTLNYFNAILLC